MSSRAAKKVVVLMGGPSAEREVSLSSGRECASALRGEGFDVVELDAGSDLCADLQKIAPDVIFNALHGRWGEDGCVQGLLEWLRIPYTHSGVMASAMAMNKERSKSVFASAGLPIVASEIRSKPEIEADHVMAPPYVVKPYNEGSSVGVYFVHESANGPPRLEASTPERMMVETYVPGRDLTVTVLGDEPLTVTDILTDGWYDYDAKYQPGGSRHVVPAELPDDVFQRCLDYAARAHRALDCRGITRTDFRWNEEQGVDGVFLLETNTQPGMTPTSLAPEQALVKGMDFGALCRWIVEDASCDR